MPKTHDLGRSFFHVIRVRRSCPPISLAKTHEIDPPFRFSRSVVLRISWRHAIVLGWWRHSGLDAEEALLQAVSGHDVDLEDPEVRQNVRNNVAKSTVDPDDEWQIISMLGVEE